MSGSLDIHANNVSPASKPIDGEESSTSTKSGKKDTKPSPKKVRHASRNMAGKILGKSSRVHACGRKTIGGRATLHMDGNHAHFGGVETCGSIWNCPVCAAKITEGRREELDTLLSRHDEAGGIAYMATFTLPHYAFQACDPLRRAVATAWRSVKSGKAWTEARERFGWLGDIRALEITHGDNGWHPHLHVLILFKPWVEKREIYGLSAFMFDRWKAAIERLGFGRCSESAFSFEPVNLIRGAADYVAKWGASLELTKAHTKRGKSGRTPFQILADYIGSRSDRDARLFREYAKAFKGARHLTWSRDIRRLYGLAEEVPDEELATVDKAKETHRASVDKPVFDQIARKHLTAHALIAFEQGGKEGGIEMAVERLTDLLTRNSIPWRLETAPGLNREWVPLITWDPPEKPPRASPGQYPVGNAETTRSLRDRRNLRVSENSTKIQRKDMSDET